MKETCASLGVNYLKGKCINITGNRENYDSFLICCVALVLCW